MCEALPVYALPMMSNRKHITTCIEPTCPATLHLHIPHQHVLPQVLAVTDDVVAVYKPPTLPVHVTGQFRKNTVICVLRTLRPDLGPLHPVHRLDKPVSGLLLLARSPAAAARISADIQVLLWYRSGIVLVSFWYHGNLNGDGLTNHV